MISHPSVSRVSSSVPSSPLLAPSSSSLMNHQRFHFRRNAIQYSPAQLRSALRSLTPVSDSSVVPQPSPAATHSSLFSKRHPHIGADHSLHIQVPAMIRAMSVEDKLSKKKTRTRPQRRHNNTPVASPRLPPAPPSSPNLVAAASPCPSPNLIPSPPPALCPSKAAASIFSFQSSLSPALEQIRLRRRSARASSVPELFLGMSMSASSFSLGSEETKAETEMSPKAVGLRLQRIVDANEYAHSREHEDDEDDTHDIGQVADDALATGLEVKLPPCLTLNIRAPRVISAYSSNSMRSSPCRPVLTSPPLQAVLFSHLQHINSRITLQAHEEEKEMKSQENSKEDSKEVPFKGRRERRNAIFYPANESRQFRERLAAEIRLQHNSSLVFASPSLSSSSSPSPSPSFSLSVPCRPTHRRRPAMINPIFDDSLMIPEAWQAQLVFADVSEGDEAREAQQEEISSPYYVASTRSCSPNADKE